MTEENPKRSGGGSYALSEGWFDLKGDKVEGGADQVNPGVWGSGQRMRVTGNDSVVVGRRGEDSIDLAFDDEDLGEVEFQPFELERSGGILSVKNLGNKPIRVLSREHGGRETKLSDEKHGKQKIAIVKGNVVVVGGEGDDLTGFRYVEGGLVKFTGEKMENLKKVSGYNKATVQRDIEKEEKRGEQFGPAEGKRGSMWPDFSQGKGKGRFEIRKGKYDWKSGIRQGDGVDSEGNNWGGDGVRLDLKQGAATVVGVKGDKVDVVFGDKNVTKVELSAGRNLRIKNLELGESAQIVGAERDEILAAQAERDVRFREPVVLGRDDEGAYGFVLVDEKGGGYSLVSFEGKAEVELKNFVARE